MRPSSLSSYFLSFPNKHKQSTNSRSFSSGGLDSWKGINPLVSRLVINLLLRADRPRPALACLSWPAERSRALSCGRSPSQLGQPKPSCLLIILATLAPPLSDAVISGTTRHIGSGEDTHDRTSVRDGTALWSRRSLSWEIFADCTKEVGDWTEHGSERRGSSSDLALLIEGSEYSVNILVYLQCI